MSDVWPIENVWAILKQYLGKVEVNDVQKFKKGNQEILVSNLPRQRTLRKTYKLYTKEATGSSLEKRRPNLQIRLLLII